MGRKITQVPVILDWNGIHTLPRKDIIAILRAADPLVAEAGRTMLCAILKGSNTKKIRELGLDKTPYYGFYRNLKKEQVMHRIDWMFHAGYLETTYEMSMPLLKFTELGWSIEQETYASELLEKLTSLLDSDDYSFIDTLKDRNRSMIFLLIDYITASEDPRFIPLLRYWQSVDYKKVKKYLERAINMLEKGNS